MSEINPSQANQAAPPASREITVPLPSRGLLYGGKLPDGMVRVRPWTTREESILYSPVGDGLAKIDSVMKACLLTKAVPTEDMLLPDRMAILLALRTATHGALYQFLQSCQLSAQAWQRITHGNALRLVPLGGKAAR